MSGGPVHVGCSGWQYADWRERFYPKGLPQRRWLEHYAQTFDTVEVNSTFYRLAKPDAVAGWIEQTPPDFVFTLKGSQYLTHMKRLLDRERGLERFYASVQPMIESPKCGPILWQLPPNFQRDDERLDAWLDALPPGRHAVEFRHTSWFEPDVYGILHAHGAAFVIGDDPRRVEWPQVVTAEWSFVRFHYGRRGRRGNYSEPELQEWAARVRDLASSGEVYAYFNNDWEGFAVANGKRLKRLLANERPFLSAYLHVLRQRPLGVLLLASVLARLPQTINGLALVLFIRAETGSYATAGAVAGGIALGMGAGAPFLGRFADRRGPGMLLPVAAGHAVLLLTIVLVGGSAPAALLVVLAVLAGAAFPPTPSVLRARIPLLLGERRDLVVPAYALDSVLVEISFVIGPLLTALLAAAFSPTVALVVSAVAAVVGNATFLSVLPAADLAERHHGGWLGPLRSPAILTLVLTMLPFGISIGALEVMLPAFSETEGAPELAGALLAVWALGSAIGGLAYGVRPWRSPVARVHLRLTLFYPLAFLPLFASGSVALMAVLLLPAGALIAPIFASRNELVGLAAPRGTETEALTWPLTALLAGISLGAAISGVLVDAVDWQAGVVAALVAALLAALLSTARRRTLLDGVPAARTVVTQSA